MNVTNLQHAIIALAMQVVIGMLSSNWWAGAAFGAAFFIGREITQAEYRWISAYGKGQRANMPEWGGLDPRVWNHLDSWLDWIVPAIATAGFAVLIHSGLISK